MPDKIFRIICAGLIFLLVGCSSITASPDKKLPDAISANDARIPDLIIGPGDVLDIAVYRNDDLRKTVKVDSNGMIMLLLAGDIKASGKTVVQLRDEIRDRLLKYILDPQVSVYISTTQSQKVMVLGEVKNPGIFTLDSQITALEAITRAGGMTDDAKTERVFFVRSGAKNTEAAFLDLKKALKKGDMSDNAYLANGDIIYVPAVAIADVSWYFSHLGQILSPIVNLESGLVLWPQAKDVLLHGRSNNVPLSIPAR